MQALKAYTIRYSHYNQMILDSLDASSAIRSKISLTKEFRIAIALLEMPVSGCTCLSTGKILGQLVHSFSTK